VIHSCFGKSVAMLGCGSNSRRLCPPMAITRAEADIALGYLDEALTEVEAGH